MLVTSYLFLVTDINILPHLSVNLGIPDERGRRALCWKLLLNYLPLTRASWSETLARKRELYRQFIGKVNIFILHVPNILFKKLVHEPLHTHIIMKPVAILNSSSNILL